jgi:hypothetical protein
MDMQKCRVTRFFGSHIDVGTLAPDFRPEAPFLEMGRRPCVQSHQPFADFIFYDDFKCAAAGNSLGMSLSIFIHTKITEVTITIVPH